MELEETLALTPFRVKISADETPRRHQCRRPDGITHWPTHAENRPVSGNRGEGQYCSRLSRRHLHGAVELPYRQIARRPRHRRERLVSPRVGRGAVLETIEPPGSRPQNLGRFAGARSGFHLRETVLVVQHVFERRLFDHAPPDVPRRRPQGFRHLHLALCHSHGNQERDRGLSLPLFLGTRGRCGYTARRRRRRVALDRGVGQMD